MTLLDNNDKLLLRLVAWKEARHDGTEAMESVAYVCCNRVGSPGFAHTLHNVIMGKNQFTSMSVPSDSQFHLAPKPDDALWAVTESLVDNLDTIHDPTGGALYYANLETMDKGGWFERNISGPDGKGLPGHSLKAVIGRQTFFA